MTTDEIAVNHLVEAPIGVTIKQKSETTKRRHKPAPAEKADGPENATNTDDQFPMALFNGC